MERSKRIILLAVALGAASSLIFFGSVYFLSQNIIDDIESVNAQLEDELAKPDSSRNELDSLTRFKLDSFRAAFLADTISGDNPEE